MRNWYLSIDLLEFHEKTNTFIPITFLPINFCP